MGAFTDPEGDPDILAAAATTLLTAAADTRTRRTRLEAGFTEAASTWKAPRKQPFERAGAGLHKQLRVVAESLEDAGRALRTYAGALRDAQGDMADVRRRAGLLEDGDTDKRLLLEAEAEGIRGRVDTARSTADTAILGAVTTLVPGGDELNGAAIRNAVHEATRVAGVTDELRRGDLSADEAWAALEAAGQVATAQPMDADFSCLDDTELTTEERALLERTINQIGVWPKSGEVMSAVELEEFLASHHDVAKALTLNPPRDGQSGIEGVLGDAYADRNNLDTARDRMDRVRGLFESLSADDAGLLALFYPRTIGNMNGVPFEYRVTANRMHVQVEVVEQRERVEELEALMREDEDNTWIIDWDGWLDDHNVGDELEKERDQLALYESILEDDRQIILFNPAGGRNGVIAELHGSIDEYTRNVGAYVPGTTSELAAFQKDANRSDSWVENAPPGELAIVTWLGADMPDNVLKDAPHPDYAQDAAPDLAEFSWALQQEIDHAAGPGNDVQTGYMGHSYGGATVGLAETYGLDADKVLHVESAGLGHGIDDTDDYPDSQDDVERYSITSPFDAIGAIQGVGGLGLGHGGDPDEGGGVTQLHSGDLADGTTDQGLTSSHTSGLSNVGSDTWNNTLAFYTGGTATTYQQPEYEHYSSPHGGVSSVFTGWDDKGETVDIK